jgi:thiol:disulfide interchange protein
MPRADGNGTRAIPRWLLIVAAALLVARVATGIQELRHPGERIELVHWQTTEAASVQAQATGLPLLYDFSAAWCGPCQRMQQEVFADQRSAQTLNALFVPVRLVDTQRETGRNDPDVAMLQARYHVDAFPTLVVAPRDGSEPTIIVGYPGKSSLMEQLTAAGVKARLQRSGIH